MSVNQDAASSQATEPTRSELRRSILQLVWPATVESVLQMGVGLVNTGMVGHLSALAIGAVGLCSRATMIGWALFQGVSTGATVLVAQSVGAGDRDRARLVATQALMFGSISVAILAAMFTAWAGPILRVFRPDPELLAASMRYLRIIVLGMPAQGIMMAAGAIMRGSGDTRMPMVVAVAVNIINIGANWTLIYGRMGFPALGINGAATATALAQWTGALLAVAAVTSRNSRLGLSIRGPWRFSRNELGQMLAIGMPATGESLFWQSAQIILTLFITGFGTTALAAHQLGIQAESISYMPTAGFSIAATSLVGQAIGARNPRLAQRSSRELVIIAACITALTGGIMFLFPRQLLALLTNDASVITLGALYLRLMATAQIPQQLSGVLSGALRGNGDTRTPMYVAATGLWGIRLPLAYVLAFPMKMGIAGVWIAMTADLYVRSLLIAVRYLKVSRLSSAGQAPAQLVRGG
ncbi:MAG: MATE family efflux transporter [Bacillota bacterium]